MASWSHRVDCTAPIKLQTPEPQLPLLVTVGDICLAQWPSQARLKDTKVRRGVPSSRGSFGVLSLTSHASSTRLTYKQVLPFSRIPTEASGGIWETVGDSAHQNTLQSSSMALTHPRGQVQAARTPSYGAIRFSCPLLQLLVLTCFYPSVTSVRASTDQHGYSSLVFSRDI